MKNQPDIIQHILYPYITKDNTSDNPITDKGATLGRVLFYDKNLSTKNTVSCSSCHLQQYAFGDIADASQGVNGNTSRHSMRLVNSRFSVEEKFFWDERAATLEDQTTMPIQDHLEMGFSGDNGDPDLNDLIQKLEKIDYYPEFFEWVYGDAQITEERIQFAQAKSISGWIHWHKHSSSMNRRIQEVCLFKTLEISGGLVSRAST